MNMGMSRGSRNTKNKKCTCQNGCEKYFDEYCDSTSIHGFKYLAEKRSLGERLLWLIVITCALFSCGYMISKIYAKYNESPIIVSFATKESPIYTIPFPAITICPITKAKKSLFNYTDFLTRPHNRTEQEKRYGKYMSYVCGSNKLFKNETYFTDDIYEALDEIKIPVDQFMENCSFMETPGQCSWFFSPIILDQSICFTFNMLERQHIYRSNVVQFYDEFIAYETNWTVEKGYSGGNGIIRPFRAYLAGAENSLDVILHNSYSDLDHLCAKHVQGFSVTVHAPFSIPQVRQQYFTVPFDTVMNAVVSPVVMSTSAKVKQYSPKARECYFSTEKHLKYFQIYAPRNCKLECITNFTLKYCGCVSFYMPRENGTRICGNAKLGCVKKAELALKEQQLDIQIFQEGMDFFCDCKPLCTDITYQVEPSQSPWYHEMKPTTTNSPYFNRTHYARLNIYFKQDSFLTSERNELYGPTDFLANFGGLLGLFTGFSLLSAAEIVYFLSIRLFCNFRLFRRWTGPEN
ncbi:pickpocket protein 28-like [Diorhabda sublineata]|uniref:pickpocket protein 28-like n=1 Tax=Diorhabda sublineata TaxID=1163346 RepID=UPI0024E12F78|nr:pickpocket protein 28-like [Diorhabda sublineata]